MWLRQSKTISGTPDYLLLEKEKLNVTLTRIPARNEIPVPLDEQLVVEFYARLV